MAKTTKEPDIIEEDYESMLPAPMEVGQTSLTAYQAPAHQLSEGEEMMQTFHSSMISFSTFNVDTFEGKLKMADTIMNAVDLADHLGEIIPMVDVFATTAKINDDTAPKGKRTAVRCIIIAEDGTSYASVATGVLTSFNTIFGLVGNPAHGSKWEQPIPVKGIRQKTSKGFNVIKLVVATEAV